MCDRLNRDVDEDVRREEEDEEDDDGADDDEDDAEEEDDDDEDEECGNEDIDHHEVSRAQPNTSCEQTDSARAGYPAKETNTTTSSVWGTGNTEQSVLFDPRYPYNGSSLSSGNWASNVADHTSYNSLYSMNASSCPSLGHNAQVGGPDLRAMGANAHYPTYGKYALRGLCKAPGSRLKCFQGQMRWTQHSPLHLRIPIQIIRRRNLHLTAHLWA